MLPELEMAITGQLSIFCMRKNWSETIEISQSPSQQYSSDFSRFYRNSNGQLHNIFVGTKDLNDGASCLVTYSVFYRVVDTQLRVCTILFNNQHVNIGFK